MALASREYDDVDYVVVTLRGGALWHIVGLLGRPSVWVKTDWGPRSCSVEHIFAGSIASRSGGKTSKDRERLMFRIS